jgi:hypothetical protein
LPSSCNPQTDPYKCDTSQYEHRANCPAAVAYGARKAVPQPAGVARPGGGAGDDAGPPQPPEQSSPVRLNRLLALGRLTHLGHVEEAGGLASHIYVDLSGRLTPTAHTESEAFSNRPNVEERCYPDGAAGSDSWEHFLSRSREAPATYHLAECFGSQCTLGAGIGAQHIRTIVDLFESGGTVRAELEASFQDLSIAAGVLTISSLVTYVRMQSDGTAKGLSWTAVTSASGARLAGAPISLAPGQTVQAQGITFGISEPFVHTPASGQSLKVVAPGLFVGTSQQSAFFGDAELDATMGRFSPSPFVFTPPLRTPPRTITFPLTTKTLAPPPTQPRPAGAPVVAAPPTIRQLTTGELIVPIIIGLGALMLLSLASRWIRRYRWGRALYRHQPFRGIDWLYRAFLKT